MKKRKRILPVILLAALVGIGGTNAYFSDQISVQNHIQMGDIDISLREFALKDGKETAYQNPKAVQPGDLISKIPRIINLAEPCWIRAKIHVSDEIEDSEQFLNENILGISPKWIRKGAYYYYTDVVEKKEAVDFFHQVRVPCEWDNQYTEQTFSLEIQAEAIQAVHFQPDFQAMSPWGNEEIELCIHEENDRVYKKKEVLQHKIEFNGIAHKLISVSDDFFSNFGVAMPGDMLTDYALLENTTKKPAVIYFHTESGDKDSDLLQKELKLEIGLNGKTLYEGMLASEELQKEIALVELQPGESGKLNFSVSVPKELKNVSALKKTEVKWIFRVEEDEKESLPTPQISPTPLPEKITEPAENTWTWPLPVKTGDFNGKEIAIYLWIMGVSGILIAAVWIKGEKKDEEENH